MGTTFFHLLYVITMKEGYISLFKSFLPINNIFEGLSKKLFIKLIIN